MRIKCAQCGSTGPVIKLLIYMYFNGRVKEEIRKRN